jgi:hypothetical protein
MKKQRLDVTMARDEIRELLNEGSNRYTVVDRVISWCIANATKSWDTAAIVQTKYIYGILIPEARALVSELHTGPTIYAGKYARSSTPAIRTWSCDWDKKMLDIPTI